MDGMSESNKQALNQIESNRGYVIDPKHEYQGASLTGDLAGASVINDHQKDLRIIIKEGEAKGLTPYEALKEAGYMKNATELMK